MEIGGRPRFVAVVEQLHECLMEAKLWSCPHCGRVGTLVGHGLLVGYSEEGAFPVVRGRRFLCSDRHRRPGCGRTFSVLLAEVVRGFVARARTLWEFVLAVVGGASRRAAWTATAGGSLSLASGYRLWQRLSRAQVHIRSWLARMGSPPPSSATEPWAQLLEHLRCVFPSAGCPFLAFQDRLQVGLLG